ncbi:MAG: hypothetical protein KatS3mg091_760 [Patescibacteria group bacterium]|nr:MAG: hypothetical protein KatS3mg091_760 [Patescibacteria group bacterium]
MALGYTLLPPSKDKVHETKSSLLERIIVTLGGRAAEEIVFGEVTTGAANDFDQATKIARMMVTEYGMSKLGPINYGSSIDIALGGYTQNEFISQATLSDIDKEVAAIINNCYKKAKKIITEHRDALDKVSTALLKNESLDEEEFEKLVGKKVQKKDE